MQFQHQYKQIGAGKSVFYAWFGAMHSRMDVLFCDWNEEKSAELLRAMCKEIERIELLADRFDPQSELSKVNRMAAIEPLEISAELFGILQDCVRYYDLSLGAFDITVQSFNNYRLGIADIQLNEHSSTVFFKNSNVQIDLCGYIKGYALDRAKKMISDQGLDSALLNFGNSSVCAVGNHPHGTGWKINLPGSKERCVTLLDQCLTSSGNAADHLHIIQPQTGEFGKVADVISVITENAARGEVLSTSLCVCDTSVRTSICEKLQCYWVET